ARPRTRAHRPRRRRAEASRLRRAGPAPRSRRSARAASRARPASRLRLRHRRFRARGAASRRTRRLRWLPPPPASRLVGYALAAAQPMRYPSSRMKGTRWFELAGEGVVVHAPDGSFAAGRAHAELHELEAARAALEWLLQPPPETQREPIHVYLVDPVATREETVGDVVGVGGLVRTVEPGVHDDQITLSLARFGIARWLNENAAAVPLLAAGVAGLVAAETGTGAPASEADDHVRSLLADAPSPADAGVSILTRLEPGGPALLDPVTAAFVAFLVESFGRVALSHFLAGYDPARRDE